MTVISFFLLAETDCSSVQFKLDSPNELGFGVDT